MAIGKRSYRQSTSELLVNGKLPENRARGDRLSKETMHLFEVPAGPEEYQASGGTAAG